MLTFSGLLYFLEFSQNSKSLESQLSWSSECSVLVRDNLALLNTPFKESFELVLFVRDLGNPNSVVGEGGSIDCEFLILEVNLSLIFIPLGILLKILFIDTLS